ncbi:TolC family protein [Sphingomonas jatrophae]|uniref:Outer membrane protein, adhesin transport system n=1 Tax=Sphingomonas jatrophae TaxID=1166337 RepID=A0A1I6JB23_9SPHN|nr:TolC family protein [Sphingomonas jatrophae]SFR76215.1 outer membrane protein, adhesin transport system [Sphingomonas jatrophae]
MGNPRDIGRTGSALALVALAATAGAAATATRDGPITLPDAAREAVAWHPAVTEAAGILGARGEEVNAARAGYLPQVSAGVGSGYDNRVRGDWRPRPQVGAQQMLFDFGKVRSAVDAARAGTRIGRAELLLAVDTLIRDTGYAVIELQRAAALRIVARDQLASIEQISQLVADRSNKGASTRSDALQAQARVEAAQATLTQIEAEQRRWASNLAFLLNRDAAPQSVAPDVPAWVMESCARPRPNWTDVPAVMAADARAERASADLRRSQAERYPTVALGGDASTDLVSPLGGGRNIYNFGFRVSSNIFSGNATRARVRGANFALDAAEAAAQRARTDTGQRLSEAQQQIGSLRQLVDTLSSRETSMRETGKLYRLQYLEMGTRTLVDLLNAEQELHQVRFEAVNTAHDLRRLEIDCLFLTGRARESFGLTGQSIHGVTL